MALLKAILLLAWLICSHFAETSPLRSNELTAAILGRAPANDTADASSTEYLTRKGVNCLIQLDPDCWDVLKMDDYVRKWVDGPRAQNCGTQGIAASEAFGDCFIDSYRLWPRCSTITTESCAPGIAALRSQLTDSDTGEGPMTPLERQQWTLCTYNIQTMSAFFFSWYTATNNAALSTSSKIDTIVQISSPPPKDMQPAWKHMVLDALLAGLAFVPWTSTTTSFFSSTARVVKQAEAPGRVLLAASAGVYNHVFPNDGSAASDLIDMATLKMDLDHFVTDLQARLSPALEAAVNNVTVFLEMANTGAFSGPDPPSLPRQVDGLEQALTTYIISVALASANWYGVVAPGVEPNALLSGALGGPNLDYGCDSVDPVTKLCNAIWSDVPNNQGFSLVQGTSFQNNPAEKYEKYFGGDHWTTPELLLVGAAKCRLKPGRGKGVGITIENGELNFDCLSQLKICTYKTECTEQEEGNCEYKEEDCPAEKGFGYDPKRYRGMPDMQATAGKSFFVPPGYMGPFAYQKDLEYPLRGTSVE
ncbi:MAG: hypothetical protein Q9219_001501 [cf. Caloplaca sp. 3 TL-2023]